MKTLKLFLLVALMSTALISCKKDDEGGGGGGTAEGTVSAKVDGATYTSDPIGTVAVRIDVGGTTTVNISSNDLDSGKNITLVMNGLTTTGTYEIGGGANISIEGIYTETDPGNPMDAQIWSAPFDATVAGEVNISELTETNIKGTFNFTGKNSDDNSTKEITDGSFNVEFQ